MTSSSIEVDRTIHYQAAYWTYTISIAPVKLLSIVS